MNKIIILEKIVKQYFAGNQIQTVLQNVDFQLNAGELIAIMGASGSGKSTLMNILGLLDRPTSGKYFLQARDVTQLTENDRAKVRNRAIGFVFQSFFLLPRLNLLQNVGLPLHYRDIPNAEIEEKARTLLTKVGLKDHVLHKPHQISGGQQQRAAIARALIGNPLLILADEPTGALDTKTGDMVMDLFKELNAEEKTTIVIVTHGPEIAAQCQRTVHIQDGEVVN